MPKKLDRLSVRFLWLFEAKAEGLWAIGALLILATLVVAFEWLKR